MSATNDSAPATETAKPEAAASPEKVAPRHTRKLGIVRSNKMEKTVVVEVTRTVRNNRYGRFQKRTVKFLADDRTFGCQPGDVVEIVETRPLSARKRWRVKSVISRSRRNV